MLRLVDDLDEHLDGGTHRYGRSNSRSPARENSDQVESWAAMAAGEACRALVNQQESAGSAWPYSRYAVAEIGGSHYLMMRWGTATTQADCPA